jgi:hypothetical protein
MPEAAVDKDSDLPARKRNVGSRLSPVRSDTEVNAKSPSARVQ